MKNTDLRTTGLEVIAGSVITIVLLALLPSLGMQNISASYFYEGDEPQTTTIPFAVDKRSDFLTVDISFSLNPLHVSDFIIGPDDCIEQLTVNGQDVAGVNGVCNMHPGHRIHLTNLRDENTMRIRIRDTGGTGGMQMRASWRDPVFIAILALLVCAMAWTGRRIIKLFGGSEEASWLPMILVAALLIRLGLAWHGGFGGDINMNRKWAQSVVAFGPAAAYTKQVDPEVMLPNYPPLSMLVFGSIGHVYKAFVSPEYDVDHPLYHIVIKLPAMLADLLTIIVIYALLIPVGKRRGALIAAALYALHPAIIHNSSIWGQTDALFSLFVLLTFLCMYRNRWIAAGASFSGAMLLKMQAIIVLPVVAAALLPRTKQWLLVAIGAAIFTIPVLLPFALGDAIDDVSHVYAHSVGFYSSLSSNAYNLWVMLYTRDTGLASGDIVWGFLSYRNIGLLLWVSVIALTLNAYFGAIHRDIASGGTTGMFMLSAAVIAYGFFLFNAEMHERYLFPAMSLGLPLLFTGRRGIILYLCASALFTLNLVSIVAFTDYDKWIVQDAFKTVPVIISTLQILVFVYICIHIRAYHRSLPEHRSFLQLTLHHAR
ncbi:glycosyltransferase family 39 protein, partial [Candidatus Peregrinibacteria bacterium]|nr:glycosyltransferase family 39 protein [Candidatus Peregrinibacteria bacterium]